MPIGFNCPACGQRFLVDDDEAGKAAKCPCGELLRVPIASKPEPTRSSSPPRAGSSFNAPPPPPTIPEPPPAPEPAALGAIPPSPSRGLGDRKRRNLATYCRYLRLVGTLVLVSSITIAGLMLVAAAPSLMSAIDFGSPERMFGAVVFSALSVVPAFAVVVFGIVQRIFVYAFAEFLEVVMDIEENTRPK